MIRRSLHAIPAAFVLAACTFAPTISQAASMFRKADTTSPVKAKMVKVTLKNRSAAPMDLLIEDKPITLAANAEYDLKVPEGTHIYGADKVVKLTVTRDLDGSTAAFR